VFLVPRAAKGVAVKGYPAQDGLRAADITFTASKSAPMPPSATGQRAAADRAGGGRGAHGAVRRAVGAMDESLKVTVD